MNAFMVAVSGEVGQYVSGVRFAGVESCGGYSGTDFVLWIVTRMRACERVWCQSLLEN
jgi:hypothetical protein